MSNFIKDIANIKLTKIARDKKLDYSNIIKEKAKKEDIETFEKEIKKEILVSLLKENLSEIEKSSIKEIEKIIYYDDRQNDSGYYIDQIGFNAIYVLYKIFER